jgi:dienelactone hydrolase
LKPGFSGIIGPPDLGKRHTDLHMEGNSVRRSTSALSAIAVVVFSIASSACNAEQASALKSKAIQIPISPLPFVLQGFLRRPEGDRHFPAVVLLPICEGYAKSLDEDWGARISAWGFVTLTLDSFGARGLKNCNGGQPPYPDLAIDAYRGLEFLIQKNYVDPKRIALVGFAWGAWQTLSATERGAIERAAEHKFGAAAAFYPACDSFKGVMTVRTLIVIGERDDWASADACRKFAAGEDDMGISRQRGESAPIQLIVLPDASHGFDLPAFQTPVQYRGRHLAFNRSAAEHARQALREFLQSTIGQGP